MNNVKHVMNEMEMFENMEDYFNKGFEQMNQGTYEAPKDNERWTGKVINNVDPLFAGRVQIQIFGKYDDIPLVGLPWAVPDIHYLGSWAGNMVIPEIDTIVRGYFDHGDIHKPVYDSVAYDYKAQLETPTVIDRKEDYPNKMILMETNYGDKITMNRATGEFDIQTRAGTTVTITAKGDITIQSIKDVKIKSTGNTTIETDADTTVNATGKVKINGAKVELGNGVAKQHINNYPVCPFTNLNHWIDNNAFA